MKTIRRGGRDELFEASPFFPLALRFQRAALRRGSCGPKTIHLKSGRKPRFTCVYLTTAGQSEHGRQTRRRWEQSLCRGSPRFSTALNLGAQRARPPQRGARCAPAEGGGCPGALRLPGTKGGIQWVHSITFTFSRDFCLNFPLEVVTWAKHPAI